MANATDAERLLALRQQADADQDAGNFQAARDGLLTLAQDLPPGQRADVRFQVASTYWAEGQFAKAREELAGILRMSEASPGAKGIAQLRLAESHVRENDFPKAQSAFQEVQSIPEVLSHLTLEAEERVKEISRVQAGLPARDPKESRTQVAEPSSPGMEIFVAPTGSNENPGTKESPFATLERARDEIRKIKASGTFPKSGIWVSVAGGDYGMEKSLVLSEQDSGTAEASIHYRALPGENPRFLGGKAVKGFKIVSDPSVLDRLPEEARGKVVQIDLKAQGMSSFTEFKPRGFAREASPMMEVFFNGKPLTMSRWPNEGFVRIQKVIEPATTVGSREAVFEYEGDRPSRWAQAKDIWMFGYWYHHWADGRISVASIDAQTRRIRTGEAPNYGVQTNQHYYYYNLLEEIDQPGEWYLDRTTGVLYLYPPSDANEALVEVSVLDEPMVLMDQVSHVTFRGLTYDLGQSDGIVIKGGQDVLVAGCTILRLAGNAVNIDGGTHHGILGCDMGVLGRGGAWIKGGDRKTLTPGKHFIENTHVYDFSRIDRTYTPAVLMEGVGNRIAHNLFHDSPHHGIRLEGNDHVIEYNEVHSVVYEADDQAGIDIFLNPSYRGNIIRYNFWHHIGSGLDRAGQAGIRLDDAISGVLMYGNVFYRSSDGQFGGIQIHGGKENIADSNLFVDCKYGVSFSSWGKERWANFISSEGILKELQEKVDIRTPPYSTRYPALAHLSENPDVNSFWRNLVVDCGQFLTRDQGIQELVSNAVTRVGSPCLEWSGRTLLIPQALYDRAGMRPVPLEEMGLYEDPLRASWPVHHSITKHYHGNRD